jgi:hypothetical protein
MPAYVPLGRSLEGQASDLASRNDDGQGDDIKLKLLEPAQPKSSDVPSRDKVQPVQPPDEIQAASSQPAPDQAGSLVTSSTGVW